jgi:hypothetical protein
MGASSAATEAHSMKAIAVLLVILVVAGAGLSWWALGHHVIQTKNGTVVLAKRYLTFQDTCVDTRAWSSRDFDKHPEVKTVLKNGGYRELLFELRRDELNASINELATQAQAQVQDMAATLLQKANEWLEMAGEELTNQLGESVTSDQ